MPPQINSGTDEFSENLTKVFIPIFGAVTDKKLNHFLASEFGFIVTVLKTVQPNSEALHQIVNKDIVVHLGSIIESMLIYYLHARLDKDSILRKKVCIEEESTTIRKVEISKTEILHVCELRRKEIKNFKIQSWHKANMIGKEHNLISPTCFKDLDYMRKERNEIHIFSASSIGVSSKKLEEYESLFIKNFKYLDRKITLL